MENTPVKIVWDKIPSLNFDQGEPDLFQALVQEVAYRPDGSAYPFIIDIIEDYSESTVDMILIHKGYRAREVKALDMTAKQGSLF